MCLLAWLLLAAAGDPDYDTLFPVTGDTVDCIVDRDLDGDSYPDLLVQSGRNIRVFLFDKARGFSREPQQTLRLEGPVFLWTLAALDGRKSPALFTAGARAIRAHPFEGRAFDPGGVDLVVHPSLFEDVPSEAPPLFLDFAPDLDRDGRSEALLFQKDRIFVMRRHPGGEFRCIQKLPLPVDAATVIQGGAAGHVIETLTLPLLAFGDFNGDGRADIAYYRDESLGIFRQGAGGAFSPAEKFDLAAEKHKRRGRFIRFEIPPRIGDVNGDGFLDVVLPYPSKGRVHVYYGREGRTDFTAADDVIKIADGWSTGTYLEDLDGDGRPDLVAGIVRKFGISEGIQIFLSGRVDLELHIHPMQAGGRFSKDPVQELRFSIPFTFQVTRESGAFDLSFRPNFKGDFNRDGRRDLLVAADDRTLKIYPGVPGRLIGDQPSGSIATHPPEGIAYTETYVADFNRDGVSDLVLKHVQTAPPRHVLEVKLSK